jgi:photosystem II stability/assembly factor-like uncharacterized protein
VHFTDASHGYVGGQGGVILVTTDGGASWRQVSFSPQIEDCNFNCISFPVKDTGWITGEESNNAMNQGTAIYKTYDGGVTWQFAGGSFDMRFSTFPTKNIGYRDAYSSDVEKTTNGGQSWNILPSAPNSNFNYQNLYFINKDTGFVGGYAEFRTINGGASWTNCQMPPDNEPAIDIAFGDNLHGAAAMPRGHINTTSDAGATWQESFSAYSSNYYPLNTITMPSRDVIFVGGMFYIGGSVDGGQTWEQYFQQDGTSFPGEITDIHFYDAYHGYAVTLEGAIYRLTRAQ